MWTTFKLHACNCFSSPPNCRRWCCCCFQTQFCRVLRRLRNLHRAHSFLQKKKKKSKSGGAEPGLERWSKDELQRGGEEEFVPQSLLHADDDPPPTTASFEAGWRARGDQHNGRCRCCLLYTFAAAKLNTAPIYQQDDGGRKWRLLCAKQRCHAVWLHHDYYFAEKKGKLEASLWCRAALKSDQHKLTKLATQQGMNWHFIMRGEAEWNSVITAAFLLLLLLLYEWLL